MMTARKVTTSSPMIALRNMKLKIERPLNRRWKMQTTGLLAVERKPPSASCDYWNCSELSAFGAPDSTSIVGA